MLKLATPTVEPAAPPVPHPAARTLGNVRDILLAREDSGSKEIKLQLSAINTVVRALRCAPEDIPADPARLRQVLNTISPAMTGLTRGSWSSVRSRVRKALQRAAVNVMASRRVRALSKDWEPLYRALPDNGCKASLGQLIGYLSDRGIAPADVSDDMIARFARELNDRSLRGKPTAVVNGSIRGWNTAVDEVPGWPQQRLMLPDRQRDGYVLPVQSFSPAFQHSLAKYIDFLTDPPDDDDAPLKGLRPNTLGLREFQFRQMASALVHQGVPIEEITSIGMLAQRDSVNTICKFFQERHDRPFPSQLGGFLIVLRAVARYQLKDGELAEWISRRARRLGHGSTRQFGMTDKNRRRIAVFRDPKHVRELLLLPYKLLKRAESGTLSPRNAAILVRTAVAVEMEIMCPVRLQNLSEIDVDRDLVRSQSGKRAAVNLFIPGNRTKNGEDIELELPKPSVDLIDLYLTKYRNQLIKPEHRGHGPRYLFPNRNGTAKVGRNLASAICSVMQRELGTNFNMHLFRHLGCFLYLKTHPGQIDVMRRVLGHRNGDTTRRFYEFTEQLDAFRLFDEHILRIREELLRPSHKFTLIKKGSKQ